jgi:hypothetical protein
MNLIPTFEVLTFDSGIKPRGGRLEVAMIAAARCRSCEHMSPPR